jgi:hypothetical protein
MKRELVKVHATNNSYMQQWKQVAPDVKIFVTLINGQPKAIIYSGTPYEFSVDFPDVGVVKYLGSGKNMQEVLLRKGHFDLPTNTWYGKAETTLGKIKDVWVTAGAARRYTNPRYPAGVTEGYIPPVDTPAVVYLDQKTKAFTSVEPVIAAATEGRYCYGVSSQGVAYVWDILSGNQITSEQIRGTWPTDFPSELNAAGYWAFNRVGNRACTVVWVNQYNRFNPTRPRSPTPLGWQYSYVVEIEFTPTSISIVGITETDLMCLAVDYDWTVAGSPLTRLEVSQFSYLYSQAVEWQPSTFFAYRSWVKVSGEDAFGKKTDGQLYFVQATLGGSVSGTSAPDHYTDGVAVWNGSLQLLSFNHGMDVIDSWYRLIDATGSVIYERELAHNNNFFGTTWQDVVVAFGGTVPSGYVRSSFSSDNVAIDIRFRSFSEVSNGRLSALFYDTGIVRGAAALPNSAGEIRHPPNKHYVVGSVAHNVDLATRGIFSYGFKGELPAVVAVPYTAQPVTGPKNIAVYVNTTIGWIDVMWDSSGVRHENYHHNTAKRAVSDVLVPPIDFQYRLAGAWAMPLKEKTI